ERTRIRHLPPPTAPELVAVAPRRKLRSQRLANADEVEPIRRPRQTHILRGHPLARIAIQPLARLNGLPALFERREAPAFARAADDPQPAATRVKRQSATDGHLLQHVVPPQISRAEETGREHGADPAQTSQRQADAFPPGCTQKKTKERSTRGR